MITITRQETKQQVGHFSNIVYLCKALSLMAEQLPNSVMDMATSCNRVISFICVVNELVEQNLATILFISSFLFEAKIYEWQRPSPQYICMFHNKYKV